ncbi:nucleotidyl transferase AbiEii/AbiGii toxin family protein [Halostella pelagica]|uniref:nucleotidyl transferase AbiEii/AbiGii toxin family protein n=1 Tax=Halostella pelagica TaxID=2583824 RepID=UPI00107FDDE5|nr:nucleotidyl transferase AbiEii/AbiGii toxin family protein [Halostella pelagica]
MISQNRLRVLARELGVRQGYAEKNYVNSWILWGIFTSGFGENLMFKGGTALSKLYFPQSWRFSEDLDFGVEGQYNGSEDDLRDVLDTVTERSGIEFTISEHHESRQQHYPTHYVDMSIQYRAVLDHPNTTSLDVMVDEYIAFDPVHHTHSYEDIPEFELQAYSVEEIFAEKLRAIFQRGAARDYYDLYQLLETESVEIEFDVVLPAFEAKCDHDDLDVDLTTGLPVDQREDIQRQWETSLPDLTGDPPLFDTVWKRLDEAVIDKGTE